MEHLDNRIASLLELYPEKHVFVCGGEEIYRILLPKCERLHITYLMDTYSSVLLENETYTKFGPIPERGHNGSESVGIGRFSGEATQELRSENPKEEEWLSYWEEVDSDAFTFDDDGSSLVRRTYVKNAYFAT